MPLPSHLLGALVVCALELRCTASACLPGPGCGDALLFASPEDPPCLTVELRIDGRLLYGPWAEAYVAELLAMMRSCPIREWRLRAQWIARLLRLRYQLPAGPPPPLQLTVGSPLLAKGAELDEIARLFGVSRRPPARFEVLGFTRDYVDGELVGGTITLKPLPEPPTSTADLFAEMAHRAREGAAAAERLTRSLTQRFAEIFGGAPRRLASFSVALNGEGAGIYPSRLREMIEQLGADLHHPLRQAHPAATWRGLPFPPGAVLGALREEEPKPGARFSPYHPGYHPGGRPSRWRPPVEVLVLEVLLELELEEQLHRLRSYHRGSPPLEARQPLSDLAFLARYLSIAGPHARQVADMMVKGGLCTAAVAKIWREAFEDVEPETWP